MDADKVFTRWFDRATCDYMCGEGEVEADRRLARAAFEEGRKFERGETQEDWECNSCGTVNPGSCGACCGCDIGRGH